MYICQCSAKWYIKSTLGHSVNIAPRTIQMCALFKPIFSFRLSISGYVILKTFTHDMSCAELDAITYDSLWVNGTRVPDRYCGEANLKANI